MDHNICLYFPLGLNKCFIFTIKNEHSINLIHMSTQKNFVRWHTLIFQVSSFNFMQEYNRRSKTITRLLCCRSFCCWNWKKCLEVATRLSLFLLLSLHQHKPKIGILISCYISSGICWLYVSNMSSDAYDCRKFLYNSSCIINR